MRDSYNLGLLTYFTTRLTETRAWNNTKGGFVFFSLLYCKALRCYRTLSVRVFFLLLLLVLQGTKAPGAAGVIHQDFEKGFIKAYISVLLLYYCIYLLYCGVDPAELRKALHQGMLYYFTTDLLLYYCLLRG